MHERPPFKRTAAYKFITRFSGNFGAVNPAASITLRFLQRGYLKLALCVAVKIKAPRLPGTFQHQKLFEPLALSILLQSVHEIQKRLIGPQPLEILKDEIEGLRKVVLEIVR